MTTPPVVQAVGTPNAGSTGAVTYTNPTHQTDDMLALFVECGQTTGVPTPPAGWAHAPNSPRAQGANVMAGNIMWIRATSSSMTNPVVPAQANHQSGFVVVIRGVDWVNGPFDTGGQGVNSNLSANLSVTGTSTTVPNTLIAVLGASAAGAADQFGAFTDASLTSVTKQQTGGTALGNAGSVDMVTGILAAAGAPGTMTATQASTQWVAIMVAILPAADATAVPATPGRRLRLPAIRRRSSTALPPSAHHAPVATTSPGRRSAAKTVAARRRSTNTPPPPAHHAPPAATGSVRRGFKGWPSRRRNRVEVVPAQVIVTPPAFVPTVPRRGFKGLLGRRRLRADVVPPQVAVTPPAYVPDARRRRGGPTVPRIARRRSETPPAQHGVHRSGAVRRGRIAVPTRRRQHAEVVPAQIVATPPAYVPQTVRRSFKGWWRRRRQTVLGIFAGAPAVQRDITLAVQLSPPRLNGLSGDPRIVADLEQSRLAGSSDNPPRILAQLSPERTDGT